MDFSSEGAEIVGVAWTPRSQFYAGDIRKLFGPTVTATLLSQRHRM